VWKRVAYLNGIGRFHCNYCGYASGLMAYLTEIIARTGQYFCPIKHAHKILGTHGHYTGFLEHGDSTEFHARLEEFRIASARHPDDPPPPVKEVRRAMNLSFTRYDRPVQPKLRGTAHPVLGSGVGAGIGCQVLADLRPTDPVTSFGIVSLRLVRHGAHDLL